MVSFNLTHSLSLYLHVYELFESCKYKFTPQYFSVYFPKNKEFSYVSKHNTMIKIRKLTLEYRYYYLVCRPYYIFPVIPLMTFIAKENNCLLIQAPIQPHIAFSYVSLVSFDLNKSSVCLCLS